MKFYPIFLLTLFLSLPGVSSGGVRPKMTARLLGNGGAGVGSILAPESLYLNPASITFYNESHFYYNKTKASFDDAVNSQHRSDRTNQDFVITDGSGAVKGGISYDSYHELDVSRKTYSMAIGTSAGKNTSLGFLVKRHEQDSDKGHRVFNQLTMGISHVLSHGITMGILVQDISRGDKTESRSTLGLQYNINNRLSLLTDFGSYYLKDFYRDTFYNAAIQVAVMEKVYARAGYFENQELKIRGNGWGLNWYGPKLSFDFGVRFTEAIESGYLVKDEKYKELAFGIDLRF